MIKIYFKLINSTKSLIIIGFLIFINLQLNGQNEFNNWYFGYNCGITFNTNPPSAMTNGAVSCYDQTSTYSDASGNLLMYSDGRTVYNRLHTAMPIGTNLLSPSNTYSHASVIVRKPGSNNLYYIFTLPGVGNIEGLRYAIIDMNLQGGLGDVISKNNTLVTPVCEKLTAVRHHNGTDIWIITHQWNTDAFYAYLLSSTGVSSPVITHIGPVHSGGSGLNYNAAGQLVASVNGDKLAIATYEMGFYGVYDFNNATGVVSNQIQITGYTRPWGVAFSTDGTKLYGTEWTFSPVYQFNLLAGNATAIANSVVVVGNATSPDAGYKAGFMQLGPDGKIYIAKMNAGYLACINNPNASGTSCNFVDNAIYLSGKTCQAGLPIFNMSDWAITDFTPQNACEGSIINFSCHGYLGFSNCLWNFGDPTSGTNNQSNLINPTHFYNNPGAYIVTLITQQGSIFDTVQHQIIIYPYANATINTVNPLCKNNAVLTLTAANTGGIWNGPGITNPTTGQFNPSVADTGMHLITYTINGLCGDADSIYIKVLPSPSAYSDTVRPSCPDFQNGSIILHTSGGTPPYSYLWSGSSSGDTLINLGNGLYTVTVSDVNNCKQSVSVLFDVTIIDCIPTVIYVPNVFSPNGDGANDVVYVHGQMVKEMTFIIYDRWGEKVFESTDINQGWDGTFRGKKMPQAVYAYYLKVAGANNSEIIKKGNISLVR